MSASLTKNEIYISTLSRAFGNVVRDPLVQTLNSVENKCFQTLIVYLGFVKLFVKLARGSEQNKIRDGL